MPTRFYPRAVAAAALAAMLTAAHTQAGDNGDGTFTNPPLNADYPDPDVIRVGDDFYMVSTTFANVPGIVVLHSKDLINWEFASHVVPRLEGRDDFDLKAKGVYRHGIFASSLRYAKGTFYVVNTIVGQNTRVYSATDIKGPWKVHELDRGAFDPGFFIDDDGTGYIATSGGWDGHITLLKLNEDYSKVVDAKGVHYVKGAEGSHLLKRGDWYYLFNAIPGHLGATVSRARNLYGPWETRPSISDRSGGHQGAIVDLPDGTWYGFSMQDRNPIGRVTNFGPIYWDHDWPVYGTPDAPDRIEPTNRKPIQGKPATRPATSDEFDGPTLGPQWEWNHNPDDSRWSVTQRPGFLRLRPTQAAGFWTARNTLTQKGQGPYSRGEVKFDLGGMKPGDVCGFGTLGKYNGHITVTCGPDGKRSIGMDVITDTRQGSQIDVRAAARPLDANEIYLRTEMDFRTAKATCSYSTDGQAWTPLGGTFDLAYDWQTGTFQGPQYAIFAYNPAASDGTVDVDWFHFDSDQSHAGQIHANTTRDSD